MITDAALEACSGFTRVTARRIARPPEAAFVTRLRPAWSPGQAARQPPEQPTTLRVEPSSTGGARHPGALNDPGQVTWSVLMAATTNERGAEQSAPGRGGESTRWADGHAARPPAGRRGVALVGPAVPGWPEEPCCRQPRCLAPRPPHGALTPARATWRSGR